MEALRQDIYFLIAKHCTHPALFWHNWTYTHPEKKRTKSHITPDWLIENGWAEWFRDGIIMRYIEPQEFVDEQIRSIPQRVDRTQS